MIQATLVLQKELRKALFLSTFTIKEADIVCEFFSYKSKVDKKDEFVVSSYQKAIQATDVYENAWKYRLKLSDDESEISSISEFNNLHKILDQILLCIELCLEFPFEKCLLNMVEY